MSTTTAVRTRRTFHPLRVSALDRLTDDAVAVTFAVPPELRSTYDFTPGQHLTVRRVLSDGSELRRSYSICSTPERLHRRGELRIGVRHITGGLFSSFAATALGVGDVVEVLPPLGSFTTPLHPTRARTYAAVVAGSGITPVLSIAATALAVERESRFTILYGNRQAATAMFTDELGDLKDRYPDRFRVIHVLSRERQLSPLLSGRIDRERFTAILDSGLVDPTSVDEWFLCGPLGMVHDVRATLTERGVAPHAIHTELFYVEDVPPPAPVRAADDAGCAASIILDGRASAVTVRPGERILNAGLRVRRELPYSCRAGVCSTCRAKLVDGQASMVHNYALDADEVAAGYILTCQATPITDHVVVDYDA